MKLTLRIDAIESHPALIPGMRVPDRTKARPVNIKHAGDLTKAAVVTILRDAADRIENGRYQ